MCELETQEGDVIVLGTDGLYVAACVFYAVADVC